MWGVYGISLNSQVYTLKVTQKAHDSNELILIMIDSSSKNESWLVPQMEITMSGTL